MHRSLCIAWLWLAGVAALSAAEILPLSEVEPGLQGYGLSVFSGSEPERFEVEVLGVWRQVAPDTSFILARLSGMNLEVSGVVAGMSGSPVYLDGRLAGAVSFAWPFALEPIAGITPIEAMRRLRDDAASFTVSAGAAVELESLVSAEIAGDLLQRRLASWTSKPAEGAATSIGWAAMGFGPWSRGLLAESLGPLTVAGASTGSVTSAVQAGSAVAAVLIDGDMRLAATGTLTEIEDKSLLAFGHPFLGVGALDVPMATTEVLTVLSNQLNSFKIVNVGPIVGAFDLDRRSGLRGEVGRRASTTPLTIEIEGERQRQFTLELARVPMMTPTLVAISVLGALDAVTQAAGSQGLDLELRFDLDGWRPLEIEQSFDGETAATDAALYVLAFADYLTRNPLASVDITSIDVRLRQHSRPRLASLIEAHASKTLVRPGESVTVSLDLIEFRGVRLRAAIELQIPTGIPEGRYSLLVGDGVSIDVARLAIEQSTPVAFGQALRLLKSLHSRRQLVVLGLFGGEGLTVAGEVLPQLPASVRSLWGAAASSSAVPLQLAIAQQQEEDMDMPIFGAIRIDLEVRRDGPIGPEAVGGAVEQGATPTDEAVTDTGEAAGEGSR